MKIDRKTLEELYYADKNPTGSKSVIDTIADILESNPDIITSGERKYSKGFIDKEIEKIDKLNEKLRDDFIMSPPELREDRYQFIQKDILAWVKHRSDMSYVKGFWCGWVLRNGAN